MRIFELRKLIDCDIAEIKRLRDLSISLGGGNYEEERVSGGTKVQCRFAEIVHKIMELEEKLERELDEYLDLEKQLIDAINKIENPVHRVFLRYRYVDQMTYAKIAEKMNFSLRQIYNIRKDCALLHYNLAI